MSPAIKKMQIPTDWYEDTCQQLDHIQATAAKFADKDEIVPPNSLYSEVKDKLKDLKQLAGFPALLLPDVCLSPTGDICLTWDAGEKSFDLIFGSKLTARLTTGFNQTVLEPKDIPVVLRQFAA